MKYYILGLKNYFNFKGRTTRKEYWMFAIVQFMLTMIIIVAELFLETYGLIYIVYVLFSVIPSISAAIRRLHDTGRSGLYFFLTFIPFIGSIWLFILLILESDNSDNRYGSFTRKVIELKN